MSNKVLDTIFRIFENEPLLVRIVGSFITLVVGFGVNISNDQAENILKFVSALAAFVLAASARQVVTPTAKAEEQVAKITSAAESKINAA